MVKFFKRVKSNIIDRYVHLRTKFLYEGQARFQVLINAISTFMHLFIFAAIHFKICIHVKYQKLTFLTSLDS